MNHLAACVFRLISQTYEAYEITLLSVCPTQIVLEAYEIALLSIPLKLFRFLCGQCHIKGNQAIIFPRTSCNITTRGRAVAQAVSDHWVSRGSIPRHVVYVTDKVTLGRAFSEYFGLPCQFSFHHSS
jgi:hypothetical protein